MSTATGSFKRARRVRGAVALEFAFAFPLLFGIFYAIVGYGLTMTLAQSMHFAAEEGARAAVSVDWRVPCPPPTNAACVQGAVTAAVRSTVGARLAWLPAAIRQQVLGTNNLNVQANVDTANVLTVLIRHPNYQTSGFIPVITLPLLGPIPHVPAILSAQALVSLGNPAS